LIKLPPILSADRVCNQLAQEKILIRNCTNFYGLSDQFIRISLKSREKNRMLAEKLLAILQMPTTRSQRLEKPAVSS
jgi:threonine-phosphate decarboxylase